MFMNGYTRESIKAVITGLRKTEKNKFRAVDKYKSTITCTLWYETTTKQVVRRGDSIRKIKGTVVRVSKNCSRRVYNRIFSISFRRCPNFSAFLSWYANKSNLSDNFMQARLAKQGTVGVCQTNILVIILLHRFKNQCAL
ncbi:uncharacterized protein EV154DRAFT_554355 [Mucor mucedo]|uniref:uncharacterized protein n=1 Tax=Mucor mucedo TaxID=29922 RepID=UPI0022201FC7|nr:uncharacterized protein EV154DRAFT_554355 [Mucor mucedo]KAI7887819.1 hypothetical protein EV154DRAFT_554355 [Mucor mucedo]